MCLKPMELLSGGQYSRCRGVDNDRIVLQAQVALMYKNYNSLYCIFIEQKYHFVGDLHVKSKQATKMPIISPFSFLFFLFPSFSP
jgi:hypothetical protein